MVKKKRKREEDEEGEEVAYTLQFDGSCQPNPGRGGAGFVILSGKVVVVEGGAMLGESCTSNVAEYCGLIAGLRHVIKDTSTLKPTSLIIEGDSELVINQMLGKYKCQSKRLQIYNSIVKGLLRRIVFPISFNHIDRELNANADAVSRKYLTLAEGPFPSGTYTAYYPNLMTTVPVVIDGMEMYASNDIWTSLRDQPAMIDAALLKQLRGKNIFETLEDTSPLSIVSGKTKMNALGFLPNFEYELQVPKNPVSRVSGPVLVVDGLPVPFHATNISPFGFFKEFGPKFERAAFPEPYCSHPYWESNVIMLPFIR
jgi:ribonuclease HI